MAKNTKNDTEQALHERWREKSGSFGDLYVWGSEHCPDAIEGEFEGFKPGKFENSSLLLVKRPPTGAVAGTAATVETWTCPAILYDKLQGVPIGCPVRIEYLGMTRENNAGQMMHDFKVFVDRNFRQEPLPI